MKIWCLDNRDPIYTDAAMQNLTEFRNVKYFIGTSLSTQFPTNATIAVQSRRPPSDFFKAGVFWLVSSKLRELLDSHKVKAEYFPVHVVRRDGKPLTKTWWCFNATFVLDWFDWRRSKYVLENGFATDIQNLVANQDVLVDMPLALAERTIPRLVAVSDTLAAAIIEGGCSGVIFRDPQDWQDPINPYVERKHG